MNLNDKVKVILTKDGAEIKNKREEYYTSIIPNYSKHTYNEGDELTTQLWCLFEEFGEHIHITCKSPFKDNEILTI